MNWKSDFLEGNWYSLTETDNDKLLNLIIENIHISTLPYFSKFNSLENGIKYLMNNKSDGNFLKNFDFLIMYEDFNQRIPRGSASGLKKKDYYLFKMSEHLFKRHNKS